MTTNSGLLTLLIILVLAATSATAPLLETVLLQTQEVELDQSVHLISTCYVLNEHVVQSLICRGVGEVDLYFHNQMSFRQAAQEGNLNVTSGCWPPPLWRL